MLGERAPGAYRICSRQRRSWPEGGNQGGGGSEPTSVTGMVAGRVIPIHSTPVDCCCRPTIQHNDDVFIYRNAFG
jgi:hypothetical protein